MTLADDCAREVEALHDAMEDWFAGRVDDDAFSRIDRALAMDFEIVSPDSDRRGREELLDGLENAKGSKATSVPPFEINIKRVETRAESDDLCQLIYEEWQRSDGDATGRVSSALFRRREDAPEGVEWVHLHETWLERPE